MRVLTLTHGDDVGPELYADGVPLFAVCLGAQTLALPREFEPFNGNAYACVLPREAVLLAGGPCLPTGRSAT